MNKKILTISIGTILIIFLLWLLLIYVNRNDVTVELKEETISNTEATIIITDRSSGKYSWGADYFLQVKEENKWKDLKSISYNNPEDVIIAFEYKLDENNQLIQELNWNIRYGKLKKRYI
jgi:hypothetical protein